MSKEFRFTADAGHPWERFADVDPYLYILTDMKRGDPGAFWESGEQLVRAELLPLMQANAVRPVLALELGCGIGRLVLPLARHVQEIVGVDISRGMVQRATAFASDNGIRNASFDAIAGPEDFLRHAGKYAGNCDFIYSLLVFQHIPEFAMIEGYLYVIRILLHEYGLAYLQFDTRPKTLGYRVKNWLPDFLLPRFWRKGIRRIRRSPDEIDACIRRAGLEIFGELSPHTAYHRYLLRLPQRRLDVK
jgi:SAM-dependent methyltransferase